MSNFLTSEGKFFNFSEWRLYWSKKFSNSSATFSPTRSTTLGIACAIGSRGRFRSVPRVPTTSSSGKPSTSLSAPLLSDGGPRWRGDERGPVTLFDALDALFCGPAAESENRLSEWRGMPATEDIFVADECFEPGAESQSRRRDIEYKN